MYGTVGKCSSNDCYVIYNLKCMAKDLCCVCWSIIRPLLIFYF